MTFAFYAPEIQGKLVDDVLFIMKIDLENKYSATSLFLLHLIAFLAQSL